MDKQRAAGIIPISSTRLSGNGQSQQGMGDAKRLLYFVNLIAKTAGVPVFALNRQTPYGHITASVHGALAFKKAHADQASGGDEETQELVRLVWIPEGFVITPKTTEAPDGYGMPPTPNKRGTPGGPLRQVIINRLSDNQYPDALYRMQSSDEDAKVIAGNLFFMGGELDDKDEFGIGMPVARPGGFGSTWQPQFGGRWITNYQEPESEEWHCHRPEPVLAETELEVLIREKTNEVRGEVGLPPLGPPLRGMAGELSQNIAYQMRWSGVQAHDSASFREGHHLFSDRAEARAGVSFAMFGENLFSGHPSSQDVNFALAAVNGWRHSPGHYANMITEWALDAEHYGFVDAATSDSGKMAQEIGTSEGAIAVQIFGGTKQWVDAGHGVHGDRPPVTVAGEQCIFKPIYPGRRDQYDYWPSVAYCGRTVYVTTESVSNYTLEVLSASMMLNELGSAVKLRVAALYRPQQHLGEAFFVLYEGDAHNFLATKQEAVRYKFPQTQADQISIPVWSKSGSKLAFCFTTLAPVPPGRIRTSLGVAEAGVPTTFVGQKLHFIEIDESGLHLRGEDVLEIDPTDFGPSRRASSCNASARLLPVYGGEVLDYIKVEVNSHVEFTPQIFEKRVYGALVFPNGRRIIYADQYSFDELGGEQKPVKGFVRHIFPFDVSDPDSVAYIQYDHPEKEDDAGISARLMIRGSEVKYSTLAYDSGIMGPHYRNRWDFYSAEYTLDSFRGDPYCDPNFSPGFSFFGYVTNKYTPSVKFNGVVIGFSYFYPPIRLEIGSYNSYVGPVPTSPHDTSYVLLGPVFLCDGNLVYGSLYNDGTGDEQVYERIEKFQYAKYKGEWIYAGRVENTLGGTGEFTSIWPGQKSHFVRSAWTGDDQYFFHSSIDLKKVTGLADLKGNILPIGVL